MTSPLRRPLRFVLPALLVALLIWAPWRQRFGHHFNFPLPASAKWVHYHHTWGRDSGDLFEFDVTDDAMREAMIADWNLKPATAPEQPMSFNTSTGRQPWWPGAALNALPERYGRVDEEHSQLWSLWVDHAAGKLYAESGDW